jgi:amino acid adenylation domain-containing protein
LTVVATNQKAVPLTRSPIEFESIEITNSAEIISSSLQMSTPEATQLVGDVLKTPSTPYQAQQYAFDLPESLTKSLNVLAQQAAIDEKALLLAAFSILCYRYTQQEAISLNLTIATDNPDTHYTAKLWTHLTARLPVRQFLAQVAALFNDIQSKLEWLRTQPAATNEQGCPLPIAITFVESAHSVANGQPSVAAQLDAEASDHADLHLVIVQQPQSTSMLLRSNAHLFKPDTIERLINHWLVLLDAIANDLDGSIFQLPLLTPAEAQQLLVQWHSPTVTYAQVPLHHTIETHAVQQPEAIALRYKDQSLSYAQLNQRANQLAHYLIQLGVTAEVPVAVCVEPSLDVVVCLLAVFKAGGVYLPLDPTYPLDRLSTILEETQPKLLLTQSHLLSNLPPITRQHFCTDIDWQTIQHLPTHDPDPAIDLEQTAYLIYTSGTTGKPKGVMASHANLVNYIQVAQAQFGFDHLMVMPAVARFTFSITFFELLSPLVAGGTLLILERDHILDFKRLICTLEQISVLHASPSLLRKLLAYIQDNQVDRQRFNGLKHVSSGGDIVPPDLLEAMQKVFQQADIFVIYGCSEISCMGCFYSVPSDRSLTKTYVGKPFNNATVRLYDPHQNLVPIGVAGEIYFSGAGVTEGYLHRPELTAEKFVTIEGQRFYRTGDLGRWDVAGNLEMLGRSDFQIKLRGIRIELGEIEFTLRQTAAVRDVVVVARQLLNGEMGLVAYLVFYQAQHPAIEEIRRSLQAKLPDYMVPAAFVVLDALPVNLNGKLDRSALPAPERSSASADRSGVATPSTDLERQLTEIWQAVLGIPQIGMQDNFFELGGSSLQAAQLFAEIERVFDKNLPLATLFEVQTIEQFAKILHQGASDLWSSVVAIQPEGSKLPLFCIHGAGGNVLMYRGLSDYLGPDQPIFGIQPQGLDGNETPIDRIQEMAALYIQKMREQQPEGPYFLAGLSSGGVIAFEMAQLLRAQGQAVALLVLMEAFGPGYPKLMPVIPRLMALLPFMAVQFPKRALVRLSRLVQRGAKRGAKSTPEAPDPSLQAKLLTKEQIETQIQSGATVSKPESIVRKNRSLISRLDSLSLQIYKYSPWAFIFPRLSLASGHSLPNNHLQQIQAANIKAMLAYRPEVYPGQLVLFRASHQPPGCYSDPTLGWGQVVTGGIEAFDVPGFHGERLLYTPQSLQVLGTQLKACLVNAQQTVENTNQP